MPRVVYDPSVSSIVVDLLLEAANGKSSLLIPVVLDTGASLTIVANDIMAQLGYDPANPGLDRQRIIMGRNLVPRPTARERRRRSSWTEFSQALQAHHSFSQRHHRSRQGKAIIAVPL